MMNLELDGRITEEFSTTRQSAHWQREEEQIQLAKILSGRMWWIWRRSELPHYWHRQPSRSNTSVRSLR